jgi:hypothetical protein
MLADVSRCKQQQQHHHQQQQQYQQQQQLGPSCCLGYKRLEVFWGTRGLMR